MTEDLYQHLVENEAILREAMHIAKIGSWKWNLKTKEVFWSDEMYDIFKLDKSSIEGKLGDAISKIIHPDDTKVFHDVANIAKKTPFEYRIIHPDKSIRYILAKTGDVTFDESGNPSFLIGIVQDITEQKLSQLALIKAKENAEAENASKSHFFATMSHEFRTPITVLLSSIQLFEQYIHSEDLLSVRTSFRHLKSMKRNSLRLLRLVNNLIDISKIDTGFYSPNYKNYDIVNIIEKIVLSVKDYVKQKNMEIEFKSNVKHLILRCDADMIERIMLNLISNAIKFSNSHCIIKISVYKKKDQILISVKDNGIGIEEDQKDAIFERYNQVQTTLSRNSEGSGIGLSITRAMVEMHHGRILVNSKPGKGSEFRIELPIVKNSDHEIDTIICEEGKDEGIILKMNVEFSDIYI